MANIINECVMCGEIKIDGVVYRYRFNEIRKKIGAYWSLVARNVNGKWEVFA